MRVPKIRDLNLEPKYHTKPGGPFFGLPPRPRLGPLLGAACSSSRNDVARPRNEAECWVLTNANLCIYIYEQKYMFVSVYTYLYISTRICI